MRCELCGKEEAEFIAEIEGTQMKVGKECGTFGKQIKKIKTDHDIKKEQKTKLQEQTKKVQEEPISIIVTNYSSLIKNAREKKEIKQEDFAKKINEKASLIHQIESGKIEPNILLAKKLEKTLNIKLIEEYHEEKTHSNVKQIDSEMTLGNIAQIRHRKK